MEGCALLPGVIAGHWNKALCFGLSYALTWKNVCVRNNFEFLRSVNNHEVVTIDFLLVYILEWAFQVAEW